MNAVAISVQVARVAAGSASEKGWVGKGAEGNAARRSAEGNKKKEKRGREAWQERKEPFQRKEASPARGLP